VDGARIPDTDPGKIPRTAGTSALSHPGSKTEVLDGGQEYLTVDEVAEVLRVSAPTVYRLVKRDPAVPVLRLPGLMRFPRERLLRWLRDREQGQGRPRGIGRQVTVPLKTVRDDAGSRT
jgi:excisionase family DNA binding protein